MSCRGGDLAGQELTGCGPSMCCGLCSVSRLQQPGSHVPPVNTNASSLGYCFVSSPNLWGRSCMFELYSLYSQQLVVITVDLIEFLGFRQSCRRAAWCIMRDH
jgi:hypothetical protein